MNDITLKEYIDTLFRERDKSVAIATIALEKRLELLNEFRAQSQHEQATFLTKAEYHAHHDRVVEDIQFIQAREIEDRGTNVKRPEFEKLAREVSGSSGRRTALIGTSTVVVAVLAILFTYTLRGGITHQQIDEQIKTASPWLTDKPAIAAQLSSNALEINKLQLQISQLQAQARFFCATRPKAGLPGC